MLSCLSACPSSATMQARLAPYTALAGARSCRARASPKQGSSYFSEADPSQGVTQLWGQGKKRDLIREKEEGELLWNVEWQSQLDSELKEQNAGPAPAAAPSPPARGFLSLSRSLALDDLAVELESPRLRSAEAAAAPDTAPSLEEGLAPLSAAFRSSGGGPRYAPTRGERRQWTRTSKFTRSSTQKDVEDAKEGEAAREAARAEDLVRYTALKQELFTLTAASAAVVTVLTGTLYSAETGASYAFGACGGLLYLRLLARSVDSTSRGASSVGEVVEGTLGGQRLLVPAILVAAWNRWNALGAPATGFELQILPILAGFFTYKGATVVQIFRDLLPQRRADQE